MLNYIVDRIVGWNIGLLRSSLANSGHGVLLVFFNGQLPAHYIKVRIWSNDPDKAGIQAQKGFQRNIIGIRMFIADSGVGFRKYRPFCLERIVLPQKAKDSRLGFLGKIGEHGGIETWILLVNNVTQVMCISTYSGKQWSCWEVWGVYLAYACAKPKIWAQGLQEQQSHDSYPMPFFQKKFHRGLCIQTESGCQAQVVW